VRPMVWTLALLLAVAALPAEENPVVWSLKTTTKKPIRAGEYFTLRLIAAIQPGWHLYSIDQQSGGPIATEISLTAGAPFELGNVTGPTPHVLFDPNFDMQVGFYAGKAEFTLPVKVIPDTSGGRQTLAVAARYQSCNDKLCLPPKTVKLEVPVEVSTK
jgi:DsbC/DsbD-like thiol-disulfide interchange protein